MIKPAKTVFESDESDENVDSPNTHKTETNHHDDSVEFVPDHGDEPVEIRSEIFGMINYCIDRGIPIHEPSIQYVIKCYPSLDLATEILLDKEREHHPGTGTMLLAYAELTALLKPATPQNLKSNRLTAFMFNIRGSSLAITISIITIICSILAGGQVNRYLNENNSQLAHVESNTANKLEDAFDEFIKSTEIIISDKATSPVEKELSWKITKSELVGLQGIFESKPLDLTENKVSTLNSDINFYLFDKYNLEPNQEAQLEEDVQALLSALNKSIEQQNTYLAGDSKGELEVTMSLIVFFAAIGAGLNFLMEIRPYLRKRNYDPAHTSSYIIRYLTGIVSGVTITLIPADTLQIAGSIPLYFLAILGGFGGGLVSRILRSIIEGLESVFGDNVKTSINTALAEQQTKFAVTTAKLLSDPNIPTDVRAKLHQQFLSVLQDDK